MNIFGHIFGHAFFSAFIFFTGIFVFIAISSLGYPFHIEWMEGHVIDTVARVMDGQGIYVEPSIEFVPFIYTPLYYYAVAGVAYITGLDFFPARLVSLIATLGSGAVLYAWVRREGGGLTSGMTAAALFFATYHLSGRWFDVARVDSLALFLSLAGLYALFHANAVLSGVLIAAAFFTKQSTIIMIAPALAAWLLIDRKKAFTASVLAVLLIACGCALLEIRSRGWFSFYAFAVPSGHGIDERHILGFWKTLLMSLGVACALMLVFLRNRWRSNRRMALAYAALAAGFIGSGYVMRLHAYSYLNVLMPVHAALALFTALALLPYLSAARGSVFLAWLMPSLALVQFLVLLSGYHPFKMIPTKEDRALGEQFLSELSGIEGDIFAPDLQWVQTRAGKKSYALGMAALDIFRSQHPATAPVREQLIRQVRTAISFRRFAAIIPSGVAAYGPEQTTYRFDRVIPYPMEYVTGAVRVFKGELYVPASGP